MRNGRRSHWFWEKVVIPDALRQVCWEWTGEHDLKGYARFRGSNGEHLAHRFSYETFVGDLLGDLTIDHLCGNKGCVNPYHLEQVTDAENQARATQRRTHCKRGHPYTPENTLWGAKDGRKYRVCRKCSNDRSAEKRRARGLRTLAPSPVNAHSHGAADHDADPVEPRGRRPMV